MGLIIIYIYMCDLEIQEGSKWTVFGHSFTNAQIYFSNKVYNVNENYT
jgi:hypothetical protein